MTKFRALGLGVALALAVLPGSARADECTDLSEAIALSAKSLAGAAKDLDYAIDTGSPDIDSLFDTYNMVYNTHMGDVNRWLAAGCLRLWII